MTISAYDPNNIFAKILKGEIPSVKLYEDDDTLAFMDVMPQATGHLLVIPKSGSRNLLDADPAVLSKLIPVVQKLAVADYLEHERREVEQMGEILGEHTPFRRGERQQRDCESDE